MRRAGIDFRGATRCQFVGSITSRHDFTIARFANCKSQLRRSAPLVADDGVDGKCAKKRSMSPLLPRSFPSNEKGHVNRYTVAASAKYRCVLIARIHIGNLICSSSRLAFRAKSRVSSYAARKYPAIIPQRRTEMQYVGARLLSLSLSLMHIVYTEKRCPINI